MPLILWHNRLPWQQYDLLKTPLILALSAYNSKKNSVTPIFYYRIVFNVIRYDATFCKVQKILRRGLRANLNVRYKCLKLTLRVFLAGHIVAMVAYCVTEIIPTCSPVIGQFFDTMIVASIDKEW